ncbi:hypothetical protein, partial [Neptunomonas japonica]|uniref:hypothetical protein n=1 Tax=Neptunomonas japonica TaxID=417574 RepID=UPI00055F879F
MAPQVAQLSALLQPASVKNSPTTGGVPSSLPLSGAALAPAQFSELLKDMGLDASRGVSSSLLAAGMELPVEGQELPVLPSELPYSPFPLAEAVTTKGGEVPAIVAASVLSPELGATKQETGAVVQVVESSIAQAAQT